MDSRAVTTNNHVPASIAETLLNACNWQIREFYACAELYFADVIGVDLELFYQQLQAIGLTFNQDFFISEFSITFQLHPALYLAYFRSVYLPATESTLNLMQACEKILQLAWLQDAASGLNYVITMLITDTANEVLNPDMHYAVYLMQQRYQNSAETAVPAIKLLQVGNQLLLFIHQETLQDIADLYAQEKAKPYNAAKVQINNYLLWKLNSLRPKQGILENLTEAEYYALYDICWYRDVEENYVGVLINYSATRSSVMENFFNRKYANQRMPNKVLIQAQGHRLIIKFHPQLLENYFETTCQVFPPYIDTQINHNINKSLFNGFSENTYKAQYVNILQNIHYYSSNDKIHLVFPYHAQSFNIAQHQYKQMISLLKTLAKNKHLVDSYQSSKASKNYVLYLTLDKDNFPEFFDKIPMETIGKLNLYKLKRIEDALMLQNDCLFNIDLITLKFPNTHRLLSKIDNCTLHGLVRYPAYSYNDKICFIVAANNTIEFGNYRVFYMTQLLPEYDLLFQQNYPAWHTIYHQLADQGLLIYILERAKAEQYLSGLESVPAVLPQLSALLANFAISVPKAESKTIEHIIDIFPEYVEKIDLNLLLGARIYQINNQVMFIYESDKTNNSRIKKYQAQAALGAVLSKCLNASLPIQPNGTTKDELGKRYHAIVLPQVHFTKIFRLKDNAVLPQLPPHIRAQYPEYIFTDQQQPIDVSKIFDGRNTSLFACLNSRVGPGAALASLQEIFQQHQWQIVTENNEKYLFSTDFAEKEINEFIGLCKTALPFVRLTPQVIIADNKNVLKLPSLIGDFLKSSQSINQQNHYKM